MDLEEKSHVGKSAIASAFEQLKIANLVQEKRQGRNKTNRIYVGKTISEIKEEFINWKSENQISGNLYPQYSLILMTSLKSFFSLYFQYSFYYLLTHPHKLYLLVLVL